MTVDEIAQRICEERYTAREEITTRLLLPMVREIVERALQLHTEGHTSQTCSQCGQRGNAGESRIAVQFTLDEMEELVFSTSSYPVKRRLICAIALFDQERADRIVEELKQS